MSEKIYLIYDGEIQENEVLGYCTSREQADKCIAFYNDSFNKTSCDIEIDCIDDDYSDTKFFHKYTVDFFYTPGCECEWHLDKIYERKLATKYYSSVNQYTRLDLKPEITVTFTNSEILDDKKIVDIARNMLAGYLSK